MTFEDYNKETERLQQLIDYKTKEAQSAPSYAQKQILDEVDKLKLQLAEHTKNPVEKPVKKPVKKRAQGLLESARNAEKTSAGIVPPPKEEPNTEGKTLGVLHRKKYESKVAKEERKEAEKAAKKKRQTQIKSANDTSSTHSGEFDIGEKTEVTTPKTTTPKTTTPTTTTGDNGGGQGEGNNPPKNEGRYNSSMYGILDAMRNGDIDKSTGIYFMLDALSKAARNTGIDIGNIGAQFTGGTVRNDYQDSLWNQRKNKMFENEISSELNKQEGTDKEMAYSLAKEDLIGKGFANEQVNLMLDASRKLKDSANKFREEGNKTLAGLYDVISSGAASGKIDVEEIAGIIAAGVLDTPEGKAASKEIIELLSTLGQTVNTTLGSVNNAASSFSNGINSIMSLFNRNKK